VIERPLVDPMATVVVEIEGDHVERAALGRDKAPAGR
jgi:hypothetical protein